MHGPVWRRVAVLLATLTALFGLATSPALASAPPDWPEVADGQESVEVLTVQHLLRHRGAAITADGIFGPNTLAAVVDFQTDAGLPADGVVDAATWAALVVSLDSGATGDAVRALQVQLNRYGAGLDVDGDFGPLTGASVADVRALYGLDGGSAVDATFWQWLVAGTPPGEQIAPGVEFASVQLATEHGMALGYVLTVDLTEARVGLLWPGAVAQTATTTALADRLGAVAGVNGDFFNIDQTGAPVGPAVVDGHALKAAVPGAQRYGPTRPPGTDNAHVFGITADGTPTVTTLELEGTATTPDGSFDLAGLNQYAIPEDGVGVFTSDWGSASRERATCGTDTDRNGPCSTETAEVEIVDGTVTRVSDEPGSGRIAADATVLVARDAGAAHLAGLAVGDSVRLDYGLVSGDGAELDTAIGGLVLAVDGEQLTLDDDPATLAPRTAVGSSADGSTLYLVAVDGRSGSSVGATLQSMADIMADLGATEDVVNLDGGGSTTLVAREGDDTTTSVRNTPSDGSQRLVPNGLGVFSE